MRRRILLTAALPYANGDIHLGHLVEYIQADIWARFQKMRGHECWYVCADDAHGTPIMLRASAEGISPDDLIRHASIAHQRDFAHFNIKFDHYHSTHSEENRLLSEKMFLTLQERGCIVARDVWQLYDPEKAMFLPDRYVRGDCPRCQAADQYGDSCEVCGNVYAPTDIKNPVSVISGATPVVKSSLHYFLHLAGEETVLEDWLTMGVPDFSQGTQTPRMQPESVNKLREWLQEGLRDWDISRDPPYFGFRIPGIVEEKYFYVWLDAPIGYMASFKHFCDSNPLGKQVCFDDFWLADDGGEAIANTELYHFIGKDILYFHGLFWPTMLRNSGYRRPTRLFTHGFLTVNSEKMSKSRGTFITAARYIESGLNPEALRYYYACKLGDRVEDIDLSLADFVVRVNSDLVGKLVNIPSRVAGFIHRLFAGKLDDADCPLIEAETVSAVAAAYEGRRYHEVIRLIMRQADVINAAIDQAKPWLLAKDSTRHSPLHVICSQSLRHFDLLIGYLSPILPVLAEQVAHFLNRQPYQWNTEVGISALPAGHPINQFSHLMKRMEDADVNRLLPSHVAEGGSMKKTTADTPETDESAIITIDDFARLDIRVATVIEAVAVAESDKLLHLTLDLGDGKPRQVFAGIKQHYQASDLVGRQVVCLANLKPRKMRFGISEGMVLAAGEGDTISLLQPIAPIKAGAKVS